MPTEIRIPLAGGEDLAATRGGSPELGTVVFAHGSGSSRHSNRNRHVAAVIQEAGMETILLDLLTSAEEEVDAVTGEHRFDIEMLSDRVVETVDWIHGGQDERSIGLFGASTGAAAALQAAARRPDVIRAVVSRGGRPDLAGHDLELVVAPTLLMVGGADPQVLDLNRHALEHLNEASELIVVPGAGHLFEEPGKLDEVAGLASEWLRRHMR